MAESDLQADRPEPQRRKPVKRPRRPVDDDDDDDDDGDDTYDDPMQSLVPYKNPRALLAYYGGIFSLLPVLGLLLGPAAIILGIMGIQYSQRNPSARGGGHAIAGIVIGAFGSLISYGLAALMVLSLFASRMR